MKPAPHAWSASRGLRQHVRPERQTPHVLGVITRARLAHQASRRSFDIGDRLDKSGDRVTGGLWNALGWIQHEIALDLLRKLPPKTWAAP